MSKYLLNFTFKINQKNEQWLLKNDKTNTIIKPINTKDKIDKGGVLQKSFGGPPVKIQKLNGKFQEQRTFTGTVDPNHTKG